MPAEGYNQAARAVGYIRVSKVGGREGDSFISPQLQRQQIEAVVRREGLEIVEVIEETDASARRRSRPGWIGDRIDAPGGAEQISARVAASTSWRTVRAGEVGYSRREMHAMPPNP